MRRLTLSTTSKGRTLTARERNQDIVARLDTVTQAIRAAMVRADYAQYRKALNAALTATTAAQKKMEEIT